VHVGVLVLLAVAAAPPGRAPLRLQFDQCPDIDQTTVGRIVAMELEAALAEERPGDAVTTAKAECADGRVRLTVDDPVTGKSTTRTLDLEGQPHRLRSRLLGLAISEAVLASWIELRLAPEPAASQPDAVASPETRREAAHIAERHLQITSSAPLSASWEIVAGPEVRRFSSGLPSYGLSAGARHWLDHRPSAGIGIDVDGSYGEHSVDKVARATATSFSIAPSLLMRSDFGSTTVTAGAGWRFGLARLSAEPFGLRPGDSAFRAWTGPFLAADLSVPLSDSLFLRGSVEIGYVLVPAHGGVVEGDVIALMGSWLGGLLSLGTKL
jgi:hypothetical protein